MLETCFAVASLIVFGGWVRDKVDPPHKVTGSCPKCQLLYVRPKRGQAFCTRCGQELP